MNSGINDILIEKVEEITTCHYTYYVRTKHLCNPNDLMKNKIDKSVAKTKCIVDNYLYNQDSSEYFREALTN